jgi:hypothetical protein
MSNSRAIREPVLGLNKLLTVMKQSEAVRCTGWGRIGPSDVPVIFTGSRPEAFWR